MLTSCITIEAWYLHEVSVYGINLPLLVSSTGFWVGICKQMAQHMGAVVCLLDLPLHRSDIGCLGVPRCLPSSASTETEETLK
ncbi:hypothetical protein DKX38_019616 [Salix brachista]|uniref:Uncharacterized protein n=1 Tax=Salix brachista TaxID=2182728 RepID=A0A5N5KGS5_9ROSI|nr:hypothetical protein DKX38_019616 [Salix brachista]